jgi:hypothetical protein
MALDKPTQSPGTLQYASTPYGYYRKIGNSFNVNKAKWLGSVIASPEALYLLKEARQSAAAAAGVHGGLIGALVVGAISAAMQKPDETRSCNYFQLPQEVRDHPDWPVKKQKKDVDVIVLPKQYVEGMRHPRFGNLIKLTAAGLNYSIEYTLFRGKAVKNFLTQAGWKIEW